MKVKEVVEILEGTLVVEGDDLELDIKSACGSDLMSDVMAYVKENVILLTGLVNPQVIRTAEMMDIKVVVFVRGKVPGESIINLAREKGITVITTRHPMFIACGKLYSSGLIGRGVWN
jgi:predicted transcriptional regulator